MGMKTVVWLNRLNQSNSTGSETSPDVGKLTSAQMIQPLPWEFRGNFGFAVS